MRYLIALILLAGGCVLPVDHAPVEVLDGLTADMVCIEPETICSPTTPPCCPDSLCVEEIQADGVSRATCHFKRTRASTDDGGEQD